MEEIQTKYAIKKFKERTNKQKSVKFEEIDLELYRAAAKCASFATSEERILHWVKTFQFRYFETLKDSGDFLIDWIDHEDHESTNFQEIEIKISSINHEAPTTVPHDGKNLEETNLLITIHLYLTTGIIMFQGSAYRFWSEKEFPTLKKITDSSITQILRSLSDPLSQGTRGMTDNDISGELSTSTEFVPVDKDLLDHLKELIATLPPKKLKKPKKPNISSPKDDIQPAECPDHKASYFATPLNRKRRNSIDSMRGAGLSARKSTTVTELKFVVSNLESEITEINNLLQAQPEINLLNDRISHLHDKITQMDNAFKINLQTLSGRVTELETDNYQLKSENGKLKQEIQSLKSQLKSSEKHHEEKLSILLNDLQNEPEEQDKQQQATQEKAILIPDGIETSNRFFVLGEESTNPITTTNTTTSPGLPHTANDLTAHTLNHKPAITPENQKKETTGHQRPNVNQQLKPTIEMPQNIVLLIDSNGKFIDTSKFTPNKEVVKIFCPTIPSVIKMLNEDDLGKPSHIVIHVGTNDIEYNSIDLCQTQFKEMLKIAITKYPTSKILLSSLVVRGDIKEPARVELNSKLGSICLPYPNVQLVNNENIPNTYLHDNKHLKRRSIGALVANLKDAMYNRIRLTKPKSRNPIDNPPRMNTQAV